MECLDAYANNGADATTVVEIVDRWANMVGWSEPGTYAFDFI